MSNFRHDKQLPELAETAPDEDFYTFVSALLATDIPGFAIRHELVESDDAISAHKRHTKSVLAALEMLSEVVTEITGPRNIPVDGNSSMHEDQSSRPDTVEGIQKKLRLHTPDSRSGADVLLAHTGPGREVIGDEDMFMGPAWGHQPRSPEQMEQLGYEDRPLTSYWNLLELAQKGTFEPIVMDNVVYHYRQIPYSSILFVASASFGPISAHSFTGHSARNRCAVTVSDITLQSVK